MCNTVSDLPSFPLTDFLPENQVLAVDESKIYCPPDKLQLPDTMANLGGESSANSQPDSEEDGPDSSEDSSLPSSPTFAPEPDSLAVSNPNIEQMVGHGVECRW